MIFRYATYTIVKKGVTNDKLHQKLPEDIKKELIKDERIISGVWVDLNKKEIVKELDRILGIPKTRKVAKYYHVEATKEDIDQFSHYFLGAKGVRYGIDYEAKPNRSKCDNFCPMGGYLSSPYIIKNSRLFKIDIGESIVPGAHEPYLFISKSLKDHFAENGITGLEYEECQVNNKINKVRTIYFAKITGRGSTYADDIVVNRWGCKKHRIPAEFHLFNDSEPDDLLSKEDFQLITKMLINKKMYMYQMPAILMTTRVLKIILESKSKGLLEEGFFYRRSFEPRAPENVIRNKN